MNRPLAPPPCEAGATPRLADVFAPLLAAPPDVPFLIAQLGQSLDGRIATITGESRDISGPAALDHLHRLRAHVDAVVVGAGTVAADDPMLTVRRAPGPSPARVVIDPTGRLGGGWRWLAEDGAARFIVTTPGASAPAGAAHIVVEPRDGALPPARIAAALFERGFRRILVEGGARTIAAFLDAGCIDRLHALVAPVIIGSGRAGLDLAPIARLDLALRPITTAYVLEGGDVLFDCDFSRTRKNP